MSRFRPRMRVMGIAAAVVLVGALALRTDLGAAPGLPAPPAVLTPSQPVPVLVADKPAPRAYVWSATRIESSIRLRGAVSEGGFHRRFSCSRLAAADGSR